jgi:nitrite reductase/ring-hydroxylating ferredoxin subunit
MLRKTILGAMLFSLVLVIVACAGPASAPAPTPTPTPKPSGLIKGKWIEPLVDGDEVAIPVSEVENNWNTHFNVETQSGTMTFMSYILDGKIYARANVCPPCRSIGFSLEEDILVCDTCATTFKAKTGDGIKGACVDYPKAAVPYKITDGNLVMKTADLAVAYQNTIKPGVP